MKMAFTFTFTSSASKDAFPPRIVMIILVALRIGNRGLATLPTGYIYYFPLLSNQIHGARKTSNRQATLLTLPIYRTVRLHTLLLFHSGHVSCIIYLDFSFSL